VLYECVVNVSEGRDQSVLDALAVAASPLLLDSHRDPDHNRSVFTLAGRAGAVADSARRLAEATVARLDLTGHHGAHPRLGVLDVVPFVPYEPGRLPPTDLEEAVRLRDDFARWLSAELGVPSFLYGPLPGGLEHTLPQVRRHAFDSLAPDFGPGHPHRSAGATAVGARGALVAYNVAVSSVEVASVVVPRIRSSCVRALSLKVGEGAQVSCNLTDPAAFGPDRLYDAVAGLVEEVGGSVLGAELVGLLPQSILERIQPARWPELGLSDDRTVEARLEVSEGAS
jgi:glutamate formiminotransferase